MAKATAIERSRIIDAVISWEGTSAHKVENAMRSSELDKTGYFNLVFDFENEYVHYNSIGQFEAGPDGKRNINSVLCHNFKTEEPPYKTYPPCSFGILGFYCTNVGLNGAYSQIDTAVMAEMMSGNNTNSTKRVPQLVGLLWDGYHQTKENGVVKNYREVYENPENVVTLTNVTSIQEDKRMYWVPSKSELFKFPQDMSSGKDLLGANPEEEEPNEEILNAFASRCCKKTTLFANQEEPTNSNLQPNAGVPIVRNGRDALEGKVRVIPICDICSVGGVLTNFGTMFSDYKMTYDKKAKNHYDVKCHGKGIEGDSSGGIDMFSESDFGVFNRIVIPTNAFYEALKKKYGKDKSFSGTDDWQIEILYNDQSPRSVVHPEYFSWSEVGRHFEVCYNTYAYTPIALRDSQMVKHVSHPTAVTNYTGEPFWYHVLLKFRNEGEEDYTVYAKTWIEIIPRYAVMYPTAAYATLLFDGGAKAKPTFTNFIGPNDSTVAVNQVCTSVTVVTPTGDELPPEDDTVTIELDPQGNGTIQVVFIAEMLTDGGYLKFTKRRMNVTTVAATSKQGVADLEYEDESFSQTEPNGPMMYELEDLYSYRNSRN